MLATVRPLRLDGKSVRAQDIEGRVLVHDLGRRLRKGSVLAASDLEESPCEYSPLAIKQAVTGYGRASKIQVQEMTKVILCLPRIPRRALLLLLLTEECPEMCLVRQQTKNYLTS